MVPQQKLNHVRITIRHRAASSQSGLLRSSQFQPVDQYREIGGVQHLEIRRDHENNCSTLTTRI